MDVARDEALHQHRVAERHRSRLDHGREAGREQAYDDHRDGKLPARGPSRGEGLAPRERLLRALRAPAHAHAVAGDDQDQQQAGQEAGEVERIRGDVRHHGPASCLPAPDLPAGDVGGEKPLHTSYS